MGLVVRAMGRKVRWIVKGLTLVSILSTSLLLVLTTYITSKPDYLQTMPIPDWPHSYQEKDPKPSLRNQIYEHMAHVSPPFLRLLNMQEGNVIPKIVHQMWIDTNIPSDTADWISKWQTTNPDWTYMFWTDKSASDFVLAYYPMLVDTYRSFNHAVQKSDMFRYLLLFTFGGVYADIDIEPLRSLDPLREWAPCILSTEPDAHAHISFGGVNNDYNNTLSCNAFMACRPHHPYFFFLISEILRNRAFRQNSRRYRTRADKCPLDDTLSCTGPVIATYTYVFYRRALGDLLNLYPADNIIAADSVYFLPTFADHAIPVLKRKCADKKLKLDAVGRRECAALAAGGFKNNNVTNDSFTNHHWYDSYHFKGTRKTVQLTSVLPNITLFPNVVFDMIIRNRSSAYGTII